MTDRGGNRGQPATVPPRQLIACFDAAERRYPVALWSVAGIPAWPLVRQTVFAESSNVVVDDAALGRGRSALALGRESLAAWSAARRADAAANRRPAERADVVFLSYSVGRRPRVGLRFVDGMTEPYARLVEAHDRRPAVWEFAPMGEYCLPRARPSALIQPALLAARAESMVAARIGRLPALDGLDAFLREVEGLGVRPRYLTPRALLRDAWYIRRLADRFARWLRRAGARLAFVSDYGPVQAALCVAAHRVGIPTVELQHGVQGAAHPVFASWRNLPPGGYASRPDWYWCWDDDSAATINAWTVAAGVGPRALIGGNAFVDLGADLFPEAADALRRLPGAASGGLTVLVSVDSMSDPVPPVLADVIAAAPDSWRFWMRCHPVNARRQAEALQRAPAALRARMRLDPVLTEAPLHLVLALVDVHVTPTWSSVVRDAQRQGVGSVALHERARELHAPLEASGDLVVASAPSAAVAGMARQASRRRPPVVDGARARTAMADLLARARPWDTR